MGPSSKTKARLGFLLVTLAAAFSVAVFQLSRHPETAILLASFPGPTALACDLRCVGIVPFLQVLGQGAKGLFLIVLSLAFLYALYRAVKRILRTRSVVERAMMKAIPAGTAPRPSFFETVIVFDDVLPLAFTGGFFKPRIFISTKLIQSRDEGELRAVILHERHHQEAKDPLKGLFVSFVSDLLFFLPVSRFLKKTYDLTSEMTADARSVARQADPLDLASSLLKVQRLGGPAVSWFFDPATERAKHLLGERAMVPWPLKRILATLVVLAVSAVVVMVPVGKNITAMFIDHGKTCVLSSGHK
ncbi:MAG TPA: M56 family metallopeptidase [Acidobacteriota bacterium]|nr:M56 family metallopeptidase [Acidobacteriota bacterium]